MSHPAPELPYDFARPEKRGVEATNRLHGKVPGDPDNAHGHRVLKGDREEVGAIAGALARFGLSPGNRRFRAERFAGVLDLANQSTVRHAFRIKNKESGVVDACLRAAGKRNINVHKDALIWITGSTVLSMKNNTSVVKNGTVQLPNENRPTRESLHAFWIEQ
jgi:hypothetical protein